MADASNAGSDPATRRRPRRRGLAFATVVGLVLLALGYRWLDTIAVGSGETRASPNGRFTASAMDFADHHFVTGAPRRWFRLSVTGPGVDIAYTGSPLPGPDFGSRSPVSVIRWEPDSSAVRFAFPDAEMRFRVSGR